MLILNLFSVFTAALVQIFHPSSVKLPNSHVLAARTSIPSVLVSVPIPSAIPSAFINPPILSSTPVPATAYKQATKIADHTYQLQLPPDKIMATPREVFASLNVYRLENGVKALNWDLKLADYAQTRADTYAYKEKLDDHYGFMQFVNYQDGFARLGFNHLGENASYAGPLNADHLIREVFAADSEHNSNQLNREWTAIGIGISKYATDIVFASSPR